MLNQLSELKAEPNKHEISRFLNDSKDMKLLLNRIYRGPDYTIGSLYINGEKICDTLEDTDRGLTQSMSLEEIKRIKIKGKTAIPIGTYEVVMNVVSPKYASHKQYEFCQGKLPRLINVPGFEGILIHIGNYPKDTDGCILVGYNKKKGAVLDSTKAFKKLYAILREAPGKIFIEIK